MLGSLLVSPLIGFEILDLGLLIEYDLLVSKGYRCLDVANATLDLFDLEAALVAQVGALRHLGQHERSFWPLRRRWLLSTPSVPPLALSSRRLRSGLGLALRLLLPHPSKSHDTRFLGGLEHLLRLHRFIFSLQLTF